ncbi:16S rRNA (guanine(527)-N(7))-methyltransferase [Vulcanibacillus modesticaldus]|uniref:Ribosomal RNA small subunit methyltransferase G n=2 Tax=Vulcanibacillus modesticaldus TaxID=337097 RepID=A0A1D2YVK0_9BACI|nr:16S rRNA (guanine(527)-N(7))-methyltransferase RsmG [Vulcanibacillus modesticaldus]OEF99683.1 16S rRNA (guanine(527)-N(7))-methyltransferase [Vulcanibacillus modesticaldus]
MIHELNSLLEPYRLTCDEKQLEQFNTYFQLLIEWNQKINLTAITEPKEVLVKHFFDSLTPAFYHELSDQTLIDIGAGAGFPSIPLKICFPELKITLLDSLNKRITFLKHVIEVLGLQNINCIHGRAEELAKNDKYREAFDIAISRAVARLNILSELSLPFVKLGGYMIALKGSNTYEEVDEAKKAIQIMGAKLTKEHHLLLPENFGERKIIIIKKTKETPKKYPRKPGIPSRKPII